MSNKNILERGWAKWTLSLITIISFVWGIFVTFHVKSPKLLYEIQSCVKLYNQVKNLTSVRLLIDTIDVLSLDQNISFYTISIKNSGNQNLRSSDYDEGIFGICVEDASVLGGASISSACNSHIM